MKNEIVIDIKKYEYELVGDVDSIMNNRRLLLAINRLNYYLDEGNIKIPFEEKTKILVLQNIKNLLDKFQFKYLLNDQIKQELSAYSNEQENFKTFSINAKNIRNNEFISNPELENGFKHFLEILKNKMISRDLYPLQKLSAFHMAFSQNSCNFAVPGAGKTSIVYGAYIYLKNLPVDDPKHVDNILVIGPLSSFAPWENEYKDCFGISIPSQRLSGDTSITRYFKEQHLYSNNPKQLTLISHAGVPLLEKEIIDFLKQNKTMVVIDEAHRIKNANGTWGKSVVEIAKEASSRVILTGTPVPNGYEDLYNLFRFIYPFKYQEILNIHYDQLKELTKNSISIDDARVQSFIENINPFFIRIKKKDLNLPGVFENTIFVSMDDYQKEIYDFIEDKYIKSFQIKPGGTVKDILNKAKLIRLRQAATNPELLLKSLENSLENSEYGNDPNLEFISMNNETIDDSVIFSKIKDYKNASTPKKFLKINEILESKIFPIKGKVIVWTIFIQNAEALQDFLSNKGIKTKLLIGRVPQDEREQTIEKFNNPDNMDFQVVIANPFSVSESISLHKGCHNAIYMERDYNCANFLQSKDRIHRVGISADTITTYYYLVSKESIDSVINEKLDIKAKRMEAIIDEDIPLFKNINDTDETDIIKGLLDKYAQKS